MDQSAKPSNMDQEREHLVHHHEGNHQDEGGFSWLTAIGFLFLTFNSGMAIYRSEGEMASVAFVAFSYLDLVALFYCLRQYERAQPNSPSRSHLKVALWILTIAMTSIFAVSDPKEAMTPGSTRFNVSVLLAFGAFLGAQALLFLGMIKHGSD